LQAQQELDRFTADMIYVEQHREELLRQYADRWIAVYNEQVVAAAKDLKRLIRSLERKGLSPGHVYREYLTENEDLLILFDTTRP
jgi:hypothetical protein